jgi:site-specific DNA recombinase
MKITVIKPEDVKKGKKRVAAYCRVSTFKEDQEESFESQVAYYKKLIGNNLNYEMAGVYADQGISGTKTENRPEFKRLIDDAMAGKIDVIYCKSISRFSRNAAQCQEIVRELKTKLVEVIFEREQLSSFNPMSEMVFNFLTILAQEESRSISENTIWALDKLAERGIRRIGSHAVFGYKEVKGVLTPNEYAPAVKMVFEEYAAGTPVKDIIRYLEQMGCTKLKAKGKRFNHHDISRMIREIIYKGDRLIQKKPHPNYLTHKPDYTREFNQYYIEEAHEPIVSKELWDKCQVELLRRAKLTHYKLPKERLPVAFRPDSHQLFGRILCADCGSPYERVTQQYKGKSRKVWRCKKKNGECHNHSIDEVKIIEALNGESYEFVDKVFVKPTGDVEVTFKKRYFPLLQTTSIECE